MSGRECCIRNFTDKGPGVAVCTYTSVNVVLGTKICILSASI